MAARGGIARLHRRVRPDRISGWTPVVPGRIDPAVRCGAPTVLRAHNRSAVALHRRQERLGRISEPRRAGAHAAECMHAHVRRHVCRRRRALGPAGTAGAGDHADRRLPARQTIEVASSRPILSRMLGAYGSPGQDSMRCAPAAWPVCGLRGLMAAALAVSIAALAPLRLLGQSRGVVVDQTGLPLPGAHIELHRGEQTVASIDAEQDGGFELPATQANDVVVVSLDGFETARVEPEAARRVVLLIAHATETTEVVASALTSSGASMEHLGSTMSAPLAQRLPTSRPRILQSLPLLPGVVRGRDGLLRIGGTRPHESTLWIDGFDVTDPVSGTTALDLPVESVRGMAVLREPVAATFGDVIGSAASIETTPGGEQLKAGVQGFIPRPRLSHLGLGKIEAFFPRAYIGGRAGIARYFASAEFNFERVPVPGVTGTSGQPNIGTTGVTSFARADLQTSTRHSITLEGLY